MLQSSPVRRMVVALLALVVSLVGVWGLLASPVYAAECGDAKTSIISCDGAKSGTDAAKDSANNPIISVLTFVMQILTGAVGIAAVGALIYAGILYSAASGESAQVQKAKTLIKDTVIGIVCYAGMILILNFVIPGGVFGQQSTTGGGTVTTPGGGDGGGGDGKGTPGTSFSFTVASWNSYVDNKSNVGTRAASLLSNADIIGLQEVHHTNQRTNLKNVASSKTGVSIAAKSRDGHMASVPVVFNAQKFVVVSTGYKYLGKTPKLAEKYAYYVKFKVIKTGKMFYFVDIHTPYGVEAGGSSQGNSSLDKAYKEVIGNIQSLVSVLKKNDLPIFVLGDFNVNYRNDSCKVSWYPCSKMKSVDLKNALASTHLSGISNSQGTHSNGSRLIDYTFVWQRSDTKVNSTTVVGGVGTNGWGGSDHKPSLTNVTISTPQ
ncbi:MAG: endonuclease/exonuclease/phosphatase family protein [Candidatus Saccharimonas sp.]